MENAKNILHLMGMESTKYGGIERFNVELSRQLVEIGYHSVFVYEEFPKVQAFADDLTATGAEIVVINSRHNPFKFCRILWRLFKQYDFELMHAHFEKSRFYAIPLAVLYGIKNIYYTFHSTVPPIDRIKLHTRMWYSAFNRYCKIIAVSRDIEDTSKRNWPKTIIKKLYLGINPCKGDRVSSRNQLKISDDTLMVMCTANFNHVKGLDILVKAVVQLGKNNGLKDVVFYIVGQPKKDRVELQQIIDEKGLTSYFHLEGISNQIPKYLSAADIYVQPSRNEGLPLSLMEACSVGLPIVASRIGGIPEVAIDGENAILFEVENSADCAEALGMMINDSEKRLESGQKSKEIYADKFQMSENVSKLIDYYQLALM